MVNRALYPFASHYLDRLGFRYHYLDEGSGPPVVMLHGNPTWSFYYRQLVLGLRDQWRVIVPDHIGCGLSDKPDDARYPYTLEQRARDVEALLEHLGIRDNLTLVLHDWGGPIGMAYAAWHPERVRRLVVLNTAAFPLPTTKRLPWPLRLGRDTWLGAFLIRGLNTFCRGAAWHCTVKPLTRDVRQMYLAPYRSWANRVAVLRFVQDIPLRPGDRCYALIHDMEAALPLFRDRPLLICWGEQDFVFDTDYLDEWTRRFPQAEVHRFAAAGHWVLEDAGLEILRLVRDFLTDHSGLPAQSYNEIDKTNTNC
ncbi:MAG: alpha/beta fold hydrolase [Gemmataceae bacterium]